MDEDRKVKAILILQTELAFIGVIGEYVGAILIWVTKRPMVIGEERLNFGK